MRHTDDEYRALSCTGKHAYPSGSAAADAKTHMKRGKRRGAKRSNVNVYRCNFCGLWHLGRPAKPLPKKIKYRAPWV